MNNDETITKLHEILKNLRSFIHEQTKQQHEIMTGSTPVLENEYPTSSKDRDVLMQTFNSLYDAASSENKQENQEDYIKNWSQLISWHKEFLNLIQKIPFNDVETSNASSKDDDDHPPALISTTKKRIESSSFLDAAMKRYEPFIESVRRALYEDESRLFPTFVQLNLADVVPDEFRNSEENYMMYSGLLQHALKPYGIVHVDGMDSSCVNFYFIE